MSQNPPPQDRPDEPPQPSGYGPPPAYGQQPPPGQQPQQQPPQPPAYQSPYQQQYPPGQFGYPTATRDHPQATLAFVLGLLSVLGLTILGPFGWYYGRKVVREIDTDPRSYTNRGLAMAGMVLGIIGTIFLILIALLLVFGIIAAVLSGGSCRP